MSYKSFSLHFCLRQKTLCYFVTFLVKHNRKGHKVAQSKNFVFENNQRVISNFYSLP